MRSLSILVDFRDGINIYNGPHGAYCDQSQYLHRQDCACAERRGTTMKSCSIANKRRAISASHTQDCNSKWRTYIYTTRAQKETKRSGKKPLKAATLKYKNIHDSNAAAPFPQCPSPPRVRKKRRGRRRRRRKHHPSIPSIYPRAFKTSYNTVPCVHHSTYATTIPERKRKPSL